MKQKGILVKAKSEQIRDGFVFSEDAGLSVTEKP